MVGFKIDIAIRRVAALDDELESLGAYKLLDERMELKNSIKDWLIGHKKNASEHGQSPDVEVAFYDEVSNWQATISERTRDEWDVEKLSLELSSNQQTRYITLQVDKTAIKEGITNGDLSRAKLESVGAVVRTPFTYALHIKERKQDDPI